MDSPWLLFLLGSELPVVFLLAFAAACRAGMGGARRGAALLTAMLTPLAAEVLRHLLLRSGQYLFLVHPVEVLACLLAGGLLGCAASRGRRAPLVSMLADTLGLFLFSALLVHAGLGSGLYRPQDVGLVLLAWLAACLTALLRDTLNADSPRIMDEQVYATGMALAALLVLTARLHWPAAGPAEQLGILWGAAMLPLLLRCVWLRRQLGRQCPWQ